MSKDSLPASPRCPAAKTFVCTKPNLTVLVGEQKKIYMYNATYMAIESKYINRALVHSSSSLNQESMKVSLPDITESDWEKMMDLLDHHAGIKDVAEATRLCALYDKYGFDGGKRVCDLFLERFLYKCYHQNQTLFGRIDVAVDAHVCAYQYGLKKSKERGAVLMVSLLGKRMGASCSSMVHLDKNHIRKIAFTLAGHDVLWERTSDILGEDCPKRNEFASIAECLFFAPLVLSKATATATAMTFPNVTTRRPNNNKRSQPQTKAKEENAPVSAPFSAQSIAPTEKESESEKYVFFGQTRCTLVKNGSIIF